MSVHEAVVWAMAQAPCLLIPDSERWKYSTGAGSCGLPAARKHPECAAAGFATNAEVRAGLEPEIASRVRWAEHDHTPRPCCIEAIVDAVLAAVAGDAA